MRGVRLISSAFAVSMLASIALMVLYVLGGQVQLEGLLLGLALGALGIGVVAWASYLLDEPERVEERRSPATSERGRREATEALGVEQVTRRRLLVRLGGGALGTLGAALAIPSLSLGPSPGSDLFNTPWSSGARVVDDNDQPLRPQDVEFSSVTTVFPAGHVGAADAQVLLLRIEEELLRLPGSRANWTPQGCVAYSKICTHAGCPVGLYRAQAHQLLCPCHQSTFDVLRGAVPVFGPAARPLPQLPLSVDGDGYLIATGDFSAPVGPSFWDLTRVEGAG
ncbi:MAG: ubiquinol-cytochrome c reductase iron-sulfur subunit [Actinomycetota bacterium]